MKLLTVRQMRWRLTDLSVQLNLAKGDERRYPQDREALARAERLLDEARQELYSIEQQDGF